jgi:hypothetical protein
MEIRKHLCQENEKLKSEKLKITKKFSQTHSTINDGRDSDRASQMPSKANGFFNEEIFEITK